MSLYWKLEQDFIGDDQYVGYYVPWITLGGLQLSTSTQRDSCCILNFLLQPKEIHLLQQ